MARLYQLHKILSTTSVVERPPLSDRFLALAQRVRDEGRDDTYYLKCADIAKRLEAGKPVGHMRRKKRTRKIWPLGENLGAAARGVSHV